MTTGKQKAMFNQIITEGDDEMNFRLPVSIRILLLMTLSTKLFADPIAPPQDCHLNRFQVQSDSGGVTCYSDHFHLGGGSKLYLTVEGAGRLTFRANGYEDWFWCRYDNWDNIAWTCKSHYGYVDVSINISGGGLHTIVWNTYSSWASSGWGDVADVKWNGNTIPLNLGPYVAETPIITPNSGTVFDTSLTVTITGDDNASIFYTLDGSTPTTNSIPYQRFRITGKTTVKAIAIAKGVDPSDIAVAHYALGTCTDPVISFENGSVFQHSNQVVSITWTATDGILRYTLDGSVPTETSAEYTGPFTISDTTTVKAKVFSDRFFDSNVASATLTREWVKVATPVIAANATFTGTRTKVALSCATEGATIRYTTDGSTPNSESPAYSRAFFVTNSCTVKAYAVLDDCTDSDVASVTIERVWGTGDSLGVPDLVFTNGGNTAWVRDITVFKSGTDSMRSGTIGNGQTSELSTTVKGKGVFSFWWKTSCEDSSGFYDWDHAEFHADGQVYYLDGETDWTQVVHEFTTEGVHELRWIYLKDDAGKDGSDCVWIDNLEWAGDPIPYLGETPSDDEVDDALYGSVDDNLYRHVTDGGKYKAYRAWADKVCGNDFTKRQTVKDSAISWLSFALDAEALIAMAPKQGDLSIDGFGPTVMDRVFDLTFSLSGISIGENATGANLAEVFGVEGATELNESAFSSEGLTFSLQRTVDGKVKATVTPAGSPSAFFLRVKVK